MLQFAAAADWWPWPASWLGTPGAGRRPRHCAWRGLALMVGGRAAAGDGACSTSAATSRRVPSPARRCRSWSSPASTPSCDIPSTAGSSLPAFGWGLVVGQPPDPAAGAGAAGVFFDLKSRREEAWLQRIATPATRPTRRGPSALVPCACSRQEETRWRGREEGADLATGQRVRVTCSTPIREGEGFLTTGAVQWNGCRYGMFWQRICTCSMRSAHHSLVRPDPVPRDHSAGRVVQSGAVDLRERGRPRVNRCRVALTTSRGCRGRP